MIERLSILLHNLVKKDEKGASAVEYGLLIAGIAAVIVAAVMALGPVIEKQFSNTCSAIDSAATCS